jgi:hypothetical protein
VSGTSATLDLLWGDYRRDVKLDAEDFDRLLGCYNLPRDEEIAVSDWPYPFRFWSGGSRAPRQVAHLACQMMHTYWHHADTSDVITGFDGDFPLCEAFPKFLKRLLEGKSVRRSKYRQSDIDKEECTLTINYRNTERWKKLHEPCHPAHESCNVGFNASEKDYCGGNAWNRWAPVFRWEVEREDGTTNTLNCYDGGSEPEGCGPPEAGCEADGIGANWNITLHPIHLWYSGYVCDQVLFLARMCLDYALSAFSDLSTFIALVETAQRLSRYALRLIAQQARLMIHEIGHVFLGSGHCTHADGNDPMCCFDAASEAWLCRVRAHLGLPVNAHETRDSGDFDNPNAYFEDTCTGCGTDGGVDQHNRIRCDTGVDGVPGEVASFSATPCWTAEDNARHCG